jgi:hypothetical protein
MTENGKTEGGYLFLTGSDMDPTEVRRAYPGARFVARAFTEVHAGEISPTFAKLLAGPGVGDVWGILITIPGLAPENVRRHTVTTDDGRTFDAVCIGDRMVSGESHLVLAAARYWELPTGYTGRLKMGTPALGVAGADDE